MINNAPSIAIDLHQTDALFFPVVVGSCNSHFSLMDDLLAETIKTGVSSSNSSKGGFADIACRGVQSAGEISSPRPPHRGFGGRR